LNLLEQYLPLEWVCFLVVKEVVVTFLLEYTFPTLILFKNNNHLAGCTGGMGRGNILSNGICSGGGHGGKGGKACSSDDYCVEGGISYGTPDLPCELGSGSGNGSSTGTTAGGGIIGKLIFGSANTFFKNRY